MPKVSELINKDQDVFSNTLTDMARDIVTFEINNSGFSQEELKKLSDILIQAWQKIKNENNDTKTEKAKASLLIIAAHAYLVTNNLNIDSQKLVDDVKWMYNLSI